MTIQLNYRGKVTWFNTEDIEVCVMDSATQSLQIRMKSGLSFSLNGPAAKSVRHYCVQAVREARVFDITDSELALTL